MLRKILVPLLAAGLAVTVVAQAPVERIDDAMNAKIRAEGMDRSQIMRIEHMLTDVYGPRLTGSPNFDNAANWAIKEMASWGMKNAHLEDWDWRREGWLNDRATGHMIAPVKDNLTFEVVAWTKSTNGTVTGLAVNLIAPQNPTEAELTQYFDGMATKVKGAIVLVGAPTVPAFVETENAKRTADDVARARYNPDPNGPAGAGGRGGRAGGRGAGAQAEAEPGRLTAQQVGQRVTDFLVTNGAAVRVNDAARRFGQIVAQAGYGYVAANTVPTVVLRNEDFGRIARLLGDNIPVTLEFNIQNTTFPNAQTQHNAIAEIAGTDKADEVVMLGGHLDSWHGATGATDNAIGCAIMMEAARILQSVGARPRRTIRVALWGGEEQGLLGSQAYVAQHFGSFESPKPEFAKLDAYWNIDTGTGLVRGASIFGPPEGARILAQIMKPFEDLKVYGASTSTSRTIGGTDSTSFNNAGLPGMGANQDSIEYNTYTHHVNLDSYERILPEDVKKNAIITASIVYHIAMRDQMMPRFPAADMPAKPAGRGGGQ